MKNAIEEWIDQAWSGLSSIPGASETVAQERAGWEDFQGLDTLEVVLFGAYDAGKSSLLKRLLVEWGAQVPEWLTVSGRRETFEAKRVVTNGIGFVDTPGLGSGNTEHDDLTLNAMRLADAYLWVLPPQLVTAGKEQYLARLFGEVGIAEATIAVIARMDEAGIDPGENAAGFSDLCERKKQEFTSLVQEASSSRQLRSIRCVVADPYQMADNTPQPVREVYDVGRSWDGIADLAQAVLALQECGGALRWAAGVRFVQLLLKDVCDELQRITEDLALSKEGMDNEVTRHAIYEQRLDALQRQERAELHRQIEEALLSASRSGGDNESSLIRGLQDDLAKVVDVWAEGSFSEYRRLVGELELEARERTAGPSMEGFRCLAEEAEERDDKDNGLDFDPVKTGRRALTFGPALRKAFKIYAEAELGMSLEEAADRLKKLESSGEMVEAFIKSQGRRATFRSAEHAKKASQFLKWASVLDAVGPLVEQFGGLLFDMAEELMSDRKAKERAQKRLELRDQLRIEAKKLEDLAAADFDSTCDGLREWISERLSAIEAGRQGLCAQLEVLNKSVVLLEGLINRCPHSQHAC